MSDFNYINDDIVLLAAMKQGNTKAYDALFKKYYPSLCVYCSRFVEIEEVEDLVQEVMVWLWEKREKLEFNTSLKAYMYKMVYNRSLNHNLHNETKLRVKSFFQQRLKEESEGVELYDMEEVMRHTSEAIEKLPLKYKEAFVMHYFDGMSYKEVAELLQVSPKTVDYRIQQALKLLRSWLKDSFYLLLPLLS